MAYASKYYDPVKAHEYYENYRKKGIKKGRGSSKRDSIASLSDEGKSIAKSVKDSINAEKKQAIATLKTEMQERIKAIKERIKAIKGLASDDILTGGDSTESLKAEIENLRAEMKQKREQINADYKERYLQELDKLKADGSYKKPTKSRKRKK